MLMIWATHKDKLTITNSKVSVLFPAPWEGKDNVEFVDSIWVEQGRAALS